MNIQPHKHVDVLVIGGGINGAGIVRDLAGRGLSVALCEKNDLASATSSASSKMIHGGLRYLEQYDFRLVREALREREIMMRSAPHITRPMTFILPHHKKMRPWWMIRLGLFLYDHLSIREFLPKSKSHSLPGTLLGQPLKPEFKRGFSYADGWVEDTRLVILNALAAAEKGAEIMTRTECMKVQKNSGAKGWLIALRDNLNDHVFHISADMVVNASGPWVEKTLGLFDKKSEKYRIRWVKGSHIIVPALYQGDHAYLLQNDDGRVVFTWPYEKEYTLVGTTDVDYKGDLEEVRIEMDEVEYLCRAVNRYFRHGLKSQDVMWTYSGVRPLVDDGKSSASKVSREYILDLDETLGAPLLSVYGGKLTTYRMLSEQAGNRVVEALGRGGAAWTEKAPLPGGEAAANFETFYKAFRREYNWLPETLAHRLGRAYGSRAREMLRGFKRLPDMGEHFGDDVYACEIDYLVGIEWAMTVEDILWRRSKLGLHISDETQEKIKKYLQKTLGKQEV